jgi:hypothetical protein
MSKFIPGVTQLLGGSRSDLNRTQRSTWRTCYNHLTRYRTNDRHNSIDAVVRYLRRSGTSYVVEDILHMKCIQLSITWSDGAHKEETIPYE